LVPKTTTAAFSSLTLYRLREQDHRRTKVRFAAFLDPKKRTLPYDLTRRFDFDAQLFVSPPEKGAPAWMEPLKTGFADLDLPESVSNSAVLILGVKRGIKRLHFAATFGFGRFLLRQGSYERNYGMRVALNAVYPHRRNEQLDPERLRAVDSKTVGPNTVRTRRQVDRRADFESFDVDVERDLLSGITGTPLDEELWGTRIDGADAVHLHRPTTFENLGETCLQLEKNSGKVPPEFSWVDNIFAVRDTQLIEVLKQHVLDQLKSGKPGNLELAPPEIVEWGDIDHFAFSFDSDYTFEDPLISEYLERLSANDKLSGLTLSQLTSAHRLLAFNAENQPVGNWSVFRCLSGEIEHHSPTYVLSEGDFFEVSKDYMKGLDGALKKLMPFDRLPAARQNSTEDAYNKQACTIDTNLLLDKQTVRLNSRTTPIEICDILTSRKDLIHVKRKLNSSSLSHLFAQGLVSADLLLMNGEFRKKARQRIAGLERQRRLGNRFSRLLPLDRGITAQDFTVVYAIIAKWKGKSLVEALPFFSKVNLRRYAQDLKRMGYAVAYAQIAEGQ